MQDLLVKFKKKKATGGSLLDIEVSKGSLSKSNPNTGKCDEKVGLQTSVKKVVYKEEEIPAAIKRRKTKQVNGSTSRLMNISHYKNNVLAILSDKGLGISLKKLQKLQFKGSFPFLEEWPEDVLNLDECQDFVVNVRDWISNLSSDTKESILEFFDKVKDLSANDCKSENYQDYVRAFSMGLTDSYQKYCDKKQVVSFI